MSTICLFGADYESPRALHEALKNLLEFPDYYGMNADALNDCLGEKTEKVSLWILNPGSGETAEAVSRVSMVIRDNGGEVKELGRA